MTIVNTSRARRIARRAKSTWLELDYAQRRLLELQSGQTGLTRGHHERTRVNGRGSVSDPWS